MERAEIWVRIIDFYFLLDFSKLYLLVQSKKLTLSFVVLNYKKEIFKTIIL